MENEKDLTYIDWQKIVGELNDKKFEELCYHILREMSFQNVNPRGGSSDGGRDLEGYRNSLEPDGITEIKEKYWFECKCYSNSIPWKEFCDKLFSSVQSKVSKFVILSNQGLSPQAKDKVEEFEKTQPVKIIEWSGFHFLDILFSKPDLCNLFFPGQNPIN